MHILHNQIKRERENERERERDLQTFGIDEQMFLKFHTVRVLENFFKF